MAYDYKDLALEMFADAEAELVEQLALTRAERDSYRLLAQESLHKLHELAVEVERERRERFRLLDELRRLRATDCQYQAA